MSRTNHGTVEILIGEEAFTLKPTLKTVKAIEQRFGGILPAMTAVGSANLSAISFIIAVGSGVDLTKKKALEPIEEAVFDAGLNDVGSQVLPFLTAFLNPAGKSPAELEAQESPGNE